MYLLIDVVPYSFESGVYSDMDVDGEYVTYPIPIAAVLQKPESGSHCTASQVALWLLHTANQRTNSSRLSDRDARVANLLVATQEFADMVAARPNTGSIAAPLGDLERMAELGLFTAPLPERFLGLGLGTEPGGHLPLIRLLSLIGGADLALGRLYEGHVNALILLAAYGTDKQIERAAEDAGNGLLFGVWNTGKKELLRIIPTNDRFEFTGSKTFASGAAFVRRPIVTAELEGQGWQMTLPRMESIEIASQITLDSTFWNPLGMESSESFSIEFSGATIVADDLIGRPGEFYLDPLFRGGAIRFAAVQAGAVIRLHRMFADWLQLTARSDDPYQVARLGQVALSAQEAVLWIERAASVAEESLNVKADKLATERMVECANMTRLAIERIATSTMQQVVQGMGAHGLLRPSNLERVVRDLTMYLRQPSPDRTLADIGRTSLRKNRLRFGGTENGMWVNYVRDGSLPSTYFQDIYNRSPDPWDFETSEYESGKYHTTLESLPLEHYRNALEIGCSIGVFTQQLAQRCDDLLGVDVSERALGLARRRCAENHNVRFARAQLPLEMPEGRFQLILISEIAYYWSHEDLEYAATQVGAHQESGDHLVLVHLTTPVDDYPLTGDEVHEAWIRRPEWRLLEQNRFQRYRIDVFERC